jgi:hypothetical protein
MVGTAVAAAPCRTIGTPVVGIDVIVVDAHSRSFVRVGDDQAAALVTLVRMGVPR